MLAKCPTFPPRDRGMFYAATGKVVAMKGCIGAQARYKLSRKENIGRSLAYVLMSKRGMSAGVGHRGGADRAHVVVTAFPMPNQEPLLSALKKTAPSHRHAPTSSLSMTREQKRDWGTERRSFRSFCFISKLGTPGLKVNVRWRQALAWHAFMHCPLDDLLQPQPSGGDFTTHSRGSTFALVSLLPPCIEKVFVVLRGQKELVHPQKLTKTLHGQAACKESFLQTVHRVVVDK